jgi:hypothetical protein
VAQPVTSSGHSQVRNRYLFNFAASYSTGGYKRLYEYTKWFNANGGAWFVIHPRCSQLLAEFPNNRFFIVSQSRLQRLYDDCAYLETIERQIGQPELYYAYGIPLYSRFGKVNWFHLSNILPFGRMALPLSLGAHLKFAFLGMKIRAGFAFADVISAESAASLGMLAVRSPDKLFLSVNGSDDELAWLQSRQGSVKEDIATVVGTASYKALDDSYRLFASLRSTDAKLRLIIIGEPKWIPRGLARKPGVVICGLESRTGVIDWLRRARIYISTTRIENSYNAAAEGIFFADESYISDIGPHRELLAGLPFERMSLPGVSMPMLHVRRDQLAGENLKSWEAVVLEMIDRFRDAMRTGRRV